MPIMMRFFNNEFQDCTIGKADLRQELKKYLKLWKWNKSVDQLLNYWFKIENEPGLIRKGMVKKIKQWKQAGLVVYLVTDNDKHRGNHLIKTYGLRRLFKSIFLSWQIGCHKADKRFWKHVLSQTKFNPAEIIFIDDNPKNVQTAKKLKINAFLFQKMADLKKVKI